MIKEKLGKIIVCAIIMFLLIAPNSGFLKAGNNKDELNYIKIEVESTNQKDIDIAYLETIFTEEETNQGNNENNNQNTEDNQEEDTSDNTSENDEPEDEENSECETCGNSNVGQSRSSSSSSSSSGGSTVTTGGGSSGGSLGSGVEPVGSPGGSGTIWTTRDDCGTEQQNVNHYITGDEVWINGKNFDKNKWYSWSIEGKPGGASCDPGQTVALGYKKTDGNGNFCFEAYTVKSDDCGEYSVKFGNKNDNFHVDTIVPTTLTLEPDSATNQLPSDTSHTFTATVYDQKGNKMKNVWVSFSTDFGSFKSSSVDTYEEEKTGSSGSNKGKAKVTIYSNAAGTAHIRAWIDGNDNDEYDSGEVTDSPSTKTWNDIEYRLSLTPDSETNELPDDTSHKFYAYVEMKSGSYWFPVGGVTVSFSTDFGSFDGAGQYTEDDTSYGILGIGTGYAKATISSSVVGTAHIRAWIDKNGNNKYDSGEVTDSPSTKEWKTEDPKPDKLSLTPDSATNQLPDDEIHEFTATVKDQFGQPMKDVVVSFKIESGVGNFQGDGTYDTKTTNSNGEAKIIIVSSVAGTASIRAWIDKDSDGKYDCCEITDSPSTKEWEKAPEPVPNKLTLDPNSASNQLPGDTSHTFTVTVVDQYGNKMLGVMVSFSTDFGNFQGMGQYTEAKTDSNGQCSVTVVSTVHGTASIRAWVDGNDNDKYDSGEITDSPSTKEWKKEPPKITKLTLDPKDVTNFLPADESHTFTTTVLDQYDQPMEGISVSFSTDFGEFDTGGQTTKDKTDANGQVSVILVSSIEGTAHIVAWIDENENSKQDPGELSDSSTKTWKIERKDIDIEKWIKDPEDGDWVKSVHVRIDTDIMFKLIIKNTGNRKLDSVKVEDNLPYVLSYNYDATDSPTYESYSKIEWDLNSLEEDESETIEFSAKATSIGSGQNIATVTANPTDTDSVFISVDDTSIVPLLIKKVWDEEELEWSDKINIPLGSNVKFKITIKNEDTKDITDLTIIDNMSSQLAYDYTENYIPIFESERLIRWHFDRLGSGESIEIILYANAVEVCNGWNKATLEVKNTNYEDEVDVKVAKIDDKKSPETTIEFGMPYADNYKDGVITTDTMIWLNATDYPEDNPSGVKKIMYRVLRGETIETDWTLYTGPFKILHQCYHKIEFYSEDNECNVEKTKHVDIKVY